MVDDLDHLLVIRTWLVALLYLGDLELEVPVLLHVVQGSVADV